MTHDNGEHFEDIPTPRCGNSALWIAVIHRAWLDIASPVTIGPGLDHQLDGATRSQTDAVEWALRDDTTVGSLHWICHAACLPDAILPKLRALARQALSKSTTR